MKKIIAAFCLLFAASFAKADFNFSNWQYYKDISNANGLTQLTLDKEVFASANKGLTDLRVVDNNNQEVPYKLLASDNYQRLREKDYSPRLLNNSSVVGKYSSAILDLGEEGKIINSFTIETPSENFQTNVSVYGSSNQADWNLLTDKGYIYDFTDRKANFKSSGRTVAFHESTFRFYKVEIVDNDGNPVVIKSVNVSQRIQETEKQFDQLTTFQASQDSGRKATILTVDLGQSGIPTNKIIFDVNESNNFNRNLLIESTNDPNSGNWKLTGQGYIFKYDTPKFKGENLQVKIQETTDRYLKITIFNNDNNPLAFANVKASATVRSLVFQAQSEKKYRLFYGNPNASVPQYDLEKYFQYLDLESSINANLDSQKLNDQYIKPQQSTKQLTERIPYLLPLALVTLGIILLLMVYSFLKKQ